MKPILYLVRYKFSRHGGAENYLHRLLQQLSKHHIDSKVFSTSPYNQNTIKKTIPSWWFGFLKTILFARWVCRYEKADQGLVFSLERIPCADIYRAGDGVHKEWLAIRSQNASWVQKIMHYLKPMNRVHLYMERRCFHNAKAIIANSERVKREIIQHYQIPSEKIHRIYNGINWTLPSQQTLMQTRSEMEQRYHCMERVVILFVGNGFYRKGVNPMLKLLSHLDPAGFVAFIIGKEKHLDRYQQSVQEYGLQDNVFFTGAVDEVEQFYALGDIFLFPTLYEPFSNACLEAMLYGNALVTTQVNGASEILPEGEFVMENPDDAQAVQILQEWIADPLLLQSKQQLHAQIASTYTMEKNVAETLQVIATIHDDPA